MISNASGRWSMIRESLLRIIIIIISIVFNVLLSDCILPGFTVLCYCIIFFIVSNWMESTLVSLAVFKMCFTKKAGLIGLELRCLGRGLHFPGDSGSLWFTAGLMKNEWVQDGVQQPSFALFKEVTVSFIQHTTLAFRYNPPQTPPQGFPVETESSSWTTRSTWSMNPDLISFQIDNNTKKTQTILHGSFSGVSRRLRRKDISGVQKDPW